MADDFWTTEGTTTEGTTDGPGTKWDGEKKSGRSFHLWTVRFLP